MSKQNKGEELECFFSRKIHGKKEQVPLLVSSLLLRRYGAGQVDIGIIMKNIIMLYEVKTSGFVSWKQIKRLNKACELLSHIFERPATWKILR